MKITGENLMPDLRRQVELLVATPVAAWYWIGILD